MGDYVACYLFVALIVGSLNKNGALFLSKLLKIAACIVGLLVLPQCLLLEGLTSGFSLSDNFSFCNKHFLVFQNKTILDSRFARPFKCNKYKLFITILA